MHTKQFFCLCTGWKAFLWSDDPQGSHAGQTKRDWHLWLLLHHLYVCHGWRASQTIHTGEKPQHLAPQREWADWAGPRLVASAVLQLSSQIPRKAPCVQPPWRDGADICSPPDCAVQRHGYQRPHSPSYVPSLPLWQHVHRHQPLLLQEVHWWSWSVPGPQGILDFVWVNTVWGRCYRGDFWKSAGRGTQASLFYRQEWHYSVVRLYWVLSKGYWNVKWIWVNGYGGSCLMQSAMPQM